MILAFELSMPRNNAWNGRWSGESRCYAIVRTYRGVKQEKRATELCGSHYYDFGDGWGARINVRAVDATEARRLRKNSAGFCGYDWMVRSLLTYGEILNDLQIKERVTREMDPKRAAVDAESERGVVANP